MVLKKIGKKIILYDIKTNFDMLKDKEKISYKTLSTNQSFIRSCEIKISLEIWGAYWAG